MFIHYTQNSSHTFFSCKLKSSTRIALLSKVSELFQVDIMKKVRQNLTDDHLSTNYSKSQGQDSLQVSSLGLKITSHCCPQY